MFGPPTGDAVISASRLQALTRDLDADLVISQALVDQARREAGAGQDIDMSDLVEAGNQEVRGRCDKVKIYKLKR